MTTSIVQAEMNYVGLQDTQSVTVNISDGRAAPPGNWEDAGFELRRHHSQVTNWDDADEIAHVHYPEISRLATEITGCDVAMVNGHIRRNPEQAANVHEQLSPITFVHSDFAASYRKVLEQNYAAPKPETAAYLERIGISPEAITQAKRLLILQFWRNTGAQKMDFPIAFCDARSVAQEELAVIDVNDYAGGGVNFQTLGVRAPADPSRHAWFTYPDMSADDVVIFRTYDSDMVTSGRPFWTPHSAYRDPDVAIGQPGRRSIELRATCLFMD